MITPAAAKAPVMPTTRPRTNGVCPAKEKPFLSEPRKLSRSVTASAARRPLIEGSRQMTTAATRKVRAFRYSATSTWSTSGSQVCSQPSVEFSTANTTAASTGVSP